MAVVALVPAGFAVQMALQQLGYGLGKWPFVLFSPSSSGYYTAARNEVRSASDFLAHYAEFQSRQDPFHLGTHPPGLVLMHYGALRLCEQNHGLTRWLIGLEPEGVRAGFRHVTAGAGLAPADQGSIWLVALVAQLASALTVLPLYFLARRGSGPAAAWTATAMWPLVPAVTLFMPDSDVLFPVFVTTSLALAVSGQSTTAQLTCGLLAGSVLWLGMFLSFGLVAVVPLVVLAILLVEGVRSWEPIVACTQRLGAMAVGVLVPTAALWLGTGHNVLATWLACYHKHASFYEVMHRSYWPWVGFNLAEFLVAMGTPLALAAIAGTWHLLRDAGKLWNPPLRGQRSEVRDQKSEIRAPLTTHHSPLTTHHRSAHILPALVAAWWLTLLALDLSGKNLGEVARLWILLMPFAVPAAAAALERVGNLKWAAMVLLSLQAVQTILFVASVQGFVDPQSVQIPVAESTR